MPGNNKHRLNMGTIMGVGRYLHGKLPPPNPNINSNRSSRNKTSNPLAAVDNETGIATDMAAATDLEEYTHREGEKNPNKSRTRKIGTRSLERGGRTTNAVVNEDNEATMEE